MFGSKFPKNPEIEPHEILLDKLAKEKEEELGISEKKFEVPIFRNVLLRFFFFSIILISLLFLRTFQLQILERKNFLALADQNRYILSKIQAERGIIYDRNLRQLVFNLPRFDLICEKNNLPPNERTKEKILKEISQILRINFQELKNKIQESEDSEVTIFENLDHKTLIILETKIGEFSGFKIQQNIVRKYEDGEYFSHLIGYLTKISRQEFEAQKDIYSISDYIGREGIEKSYEAILRRNPGKIRIERNARGKIISQEIISLPESGKNLVLWLDSDLQKKIKIELEKRIKEIGGKGGAAVAMDPKTGGILAMVSLPTFDNNLFSQRLSSAELEKLFQNPSRPLNNRALTGQYLLGSTIKPLIAAAALEEKIILPEKKINCQGQITIPHPYQPEKATIKKDWTVHGWTDLRKAIAESCNVYFYTIGGGYGEIKGLGPTKIKKYLQLFGLGEVSKIDLPIPQWAKGLLPDPDWKKETIKEPWWDGDTYNLSIGQGYILATPLQIATAFSAIANGGKLLEPKVVQKIIDSQGNLIEEIQPKVIRENFIDPKNLQIVREGMRWTVTGQNSPYASALTLNSLPVSTAAKTGTAQVDRKGCRNCYNIWLTVFAPYEDPQIVLTIVVEDVKGLMSGIILPVAKEILNWYFSR